MRTVDFRTLAGTATATAILLVYGLFRPDSMEFSVPFLIAPFLVLSWSVVRTSDATTHRSAMFVTWGIVVATMLVVAVNWAR